MTDTMHTFSFSRNNIDFTVNVVSCWTNDGFGDQWKLTDTHEGGVTIQNSEADRNSFKFAIPQQVTLSELTKEYAKQGRANPSQEAYASLQRQLMRDIHASDYYFTVDAHAGSVTLLTDEVIACGFDWSHHDGEDLEDTAREVWNGNGGESEALEAATKAARKILDEMDVLKNVVNAE
jgi:hypothetical protein|nr:MAG TPA: hypothetical protein [Caudoviricetes sp.]